MQRHGQATTHCTVTAHSGASTKPTHTFHLTRQIVIFFSRFPPSPKEQQ
jgi:hypothetical protein